MSQPNAETPLIWLDESKAPPERSVEGVKPWDVLIVDDDRDVHFVTRLALHWLRFRDRPIRFHDAFSAAEARATLAKFPEIGLVLLDAVMETDHAGLDFVRHVREDLGNQTLRILLRTGQPGQAPEERVVLDYDIDGYLAKGGTTTPNLVSAVIASLRAYDVLESLERQHRGLAAIMELSGRLSLMPSLDAVISGVLDAAPSLLGLGENAGMLTIRGVEAEPVLSAGRGSLAAAVGLGLNASPLLPGPVILDAMSTGRPCIAANEAAIPIALEASHSLLLRLDIRRPLDKIDVTLVEIFGDRVATCCQTAFRADQLARANAELAMAKQSAEQSLTELKAAQSRLLIQEKMASLGQLTAGIAHEIKNPLNFINNFAALAGDLLLELEGALDCEDRAEVDEISVMLRENLVRIRQHGERADGIVRGMLLQSRGGEGDWRVTDLNRLIGDATALAYHGARAQDHNFNCALEQRYAADLGETEIIAQNITRVVINLLSNAFYAVHARKLGNAPPGWKPIIQVETENLGDMVRFRVRDNGTGMPAEISAKLFTAFFTTKPSGEGTGLGLSLSWDIVVNQHGGTITVDSAPDSHTEFTVTLPRHPAKSKSAPT